MDGREHVITQTGDLLAGERNKRTRRQGAVSEAMTSGWGGVWPVSRATGISRKTIRQGIKGGERGLRIATEAELTAAALMPRVEGLTPCLPGNNIHQLHASGRERSKATGPRNHDPHRAAHDQRGRCSCAPSDAPLDLAGRANVLFQAMGGPRQIFDLGAVQEPVPRTRRDFLDVRHGRSECTQPLLVLSHRL
jgi:hypothetical protein